MKKFIKKLLIFISKVLPPKKIIIFESAPDYSDNSKAVFEEMLRRNLNNKYKLIWICFEKIKKNYPIIKKVKFISSTKVYSWWLIQRAKCIICCNQFIYSSNKNAFNVYLCHGNPLKNTKGYYVVPKEFQCILASSEGTKEILSSFYGYESNRIYPLGYPRNDILCKESNLDLHKLLNKNFKKIIVWYPTVRQFKGGRTTGTDHALPIIWNEEKAISLNDFASSIDILIVLKPHFAQNVSNIKILNLSNIVFIDDSFFEKNDISSYQFVASCDALLTDFSSIYYDYTLCDKPIGLIWEDYEEYKKNPGFSIDVDFVMKGGKKIYCLDDLKAFLDNVSNGIDYLKSERRVIRDFANCSTDGRNSERVVNFIIDKSKLF